MSIFLFLLFVFVVFILFPIVKFIFKVGYQVKKAKQYYQQATGQTNSSSYGNDNNYEQHSHNKQHSKVFSPSDGEYVEFEEVKTDREHTTTEPIEYDEYETQVSDVDFEEIK